MAKIYPTIPVKDGADVNLSIARRLQTTNPIFAREFQSRWRRPLTYLIVLGYSVVWSGLAWQLYLTRQASFWAGEVAVRSTLPGHALFNETSWLQIILWAIIAPILTAPAITAERERRMLSELMFTPLTARDIVRGKFLSAIVFVFVMLAVPLPITALCFQIGGVSPAEFLLAFTMQAAIAVGGAALGMYCSAASRKTATALGGSFCVGVLGAALLFYWRSVASNFYPATVVVLCSIVLSIVFVCLKAAENDVAESVTEDEPWEVSPPSVTETPQLVPIEDIPAFSNQISWAQRPVAQSWLTPVRDVPEIDDEEPDLDFADSLLDEGGYSTESMADEEALVVQERERVVLSEPAVPFVWMKRWIESNPLIQREWRIRWRPSANSMQTGEHDAGLQILCAPYMLKVWLICGLVLGLAIPSASVCWCAVLLLHFVLISYCAIGASLSFIRERDQGMLPMLLLTRLSPREIVWGKQSIPLVFGLFYFSPFVVALAGWGLGYHPALPIVGVIFVLASAWCATSFGVLFSRLCRHTAFASLGALAASLFTVVMTTPYIMPGRSRLESGMNWIFYGSDWTRYEGGFRWFLFGFTGNEVSGVNYMLGLLQQSLCLLLIGSAVLLFVEYLLRPTALEDESRSLLHTDLSRNLTSGSVQASTK